MDVPYIISAYSGITTGFDTEILKGEEQKDCMNKWLSKQRLPRGTGRVESTAVISESEAPEMYSSITHFPSPFVMCGEGMLDLTTFRKVS